MITYNMRYRGPIEYEKFVLNILQYHNEVENTYSFLMNKNKALLSGQQSVTEIYDSLQNKVDALYANLLR
jgi:hypothetical protein